MQDGTSPIFSERFLRLSMSPEGRSSGASTSRLGLHSGAQSLKWNKWNIDEHGQKGTPYSKEHQKAFVRVKMTLPGVQTHSTSS